MRNIAADVHAQPARIIVTACRCSKGGIGSARWETVGGGAEEPDVAAREECKAADDAAAAGARSADVDGRGTAVSLALGGTSSS